MHIMYNRSHTLHVSFKYIAVEIRPFWHWWCLDERLLSAHGRCKETCWGWSRRREARFGAWPLIGRSSLKHGPGSVCWIWWRVKVMINRCSNFFLIFTWSDIIQLLSTTKALMFQTSQQLKKNSEDQKCWRHPLGTQWGSTCAGPLDRWCMRYEWMKFGSVGLVKAGFTQKTLIRLTEYRSLVC